jgi:CheY-like chemotaxis protein
MGIGMPQSDLDKIFEPFYTKKVMGRSGTGLGMSVVWGTVKDHEGFFDITTEEGTGTSFVLYFPASRAEREIPRSVYIDDYLGKGESILVIDDAPEQRDLAGRMMQRLGYEVHTADSGEAAVALLKKETYDLLILDMIMPPGMNGLETYRQVLTIVPGQKAVIASGYAETERVQETQRLGAGSYIRKPYTLEKIGLAVRSELDRKPTNR